MVWFTAMEEHLQGGGVLTTDRVREWIKEVSAAVKRLSKYGDAEAVGAVEKYNERLEELRAVASHLPAKTHSKWHCYWYTVNMERLTLHG